MTYKKSALKVVVVGHVDHGKSTLIGRLLNNKAEAIPAYLVDHLQEERDQGRTIETTQVFLETPNRDYIMIDAPGHLEFLQNMVTGATQAEAAIIVLDVNEGIKAQTKHHAYILSWLGFRQVIVAVNKMDLINFNEEKYHSIVKQLDKFLQSINLQPCCYLPISALNNDNLTTKSTQLAWFNGPPLLTTLETLPSINSKDKSSLILPIQDIYEINNKKIAVGRIASGQIKVGQAIQVLPKKSQTKIATIVINNQEVSQAACGQNIGLTIKDSLLLKRGDIICLSKQAPTSTNSFAALILWLLPLELEQRKDLTIRCSTQTSACKISKTTPKDYSAEQATIITDAPIVTFPINQVPELGRFVLEKEGTVCAAGIVLKS
ncbi:MAG: GTP-binding protein [bacterium]